MSGWGRRILQATSLLAFALLAAPPPPLRAQVARDSTLRTAERAAREWLWLIDEERYDTAWDVVSPAMRAAVAFPQWATSLRQLRAAAGLPHPLRRVLLRAEPTVPLFGGAAVILSFDLGAARAAPRSRLREVLVLSRPDRRWLVAGYGLLAEPDSLTPARSPAPPAR